METYNSYKYIRLAHVQNNLYQSFGTETQSNLYLMTKYILPVHLFTCGRRNDGICFWKAYDMVDKKQLNSYSRRKFISMKNNFI